jgi:putative nucleotidyltransferase with HDIG domain
MKVRTAELRDGMINADTLKDKDGTVVIEQDTYLDNALIKKIKEHHITSVNVLARKIVGSDDSVPLQVHLPLSLLESLQNKATEKKEKIAPVSSITYSQKVRQSPQFMEYQISYSTALEMLKTHLNQIVNDKQPVNEQQLLEIISRVLDGKKTTIHIFDMLHNMRQLDDSIYAHSLNVAIISRVLGKWLGLSNELLDRLALAALLHDIGKIMIPSEIINKPGKLTDEEFALIRTHAQLGYDRLKDEDIHEDIKLAALMHHERCDGSGYPSHLKSKEIIPAAQIIGIADVYDAMTANRSYRSALCPFEVIAKFESEGVSQYNPRFIMTFLNKIADTYQTNRILLNDGRGGNIVMLNPHHLSRPIVKLDNGSFIDLSMQPEYYIQAII